MRRLVVIGAGGHARVCLDILTQSGDVDVVGCVATSTYGELQRPYLGDLGELSALVADGVTDAFVAIGDNANRREACAQAEQAGLRLANAVSAAAVVSATASLGRNVLVTPGAVVNAYARLGDGVIVNTGASVDHDCVVADWVHVAPGARLGGAVTVGEGALIGMAAAVLPNLSVGNWARIGAGAVAVADVSAETTVRGVPARS